VASSNETTCSLARLHATAVAAIVLSGEPKIHEPLIRAWARTLAHYKLEPRSHLRPIFEALRRVSASRGEAVDDFEPELEAVEIYVLGLSARDSSSLSHRHERRKGRTSQIYRDL
jgi:hypothetical protein